MSRRSKEGSLPGAGRRAADGVVLKSGGRPRSSGRPSRRSGGMPAARVYARSLLPSSARRLSHAARHPPEGAQIMANSSAARAAAAAQVAAPSRASRRATRARGADRRRPQLEVGGADTDAEVRSRDDRRRMRAAQVALASGSISSAAIAAGDRPRRRRRSMGSSRSIATLMVEEKNGDSARRRRAGPPTSCAAAGRPADRGEEGDGRATSPVAAACTSSPQSWPSWRPPRRIQSEAPSTTTPRIRSPSHHLRPLAGAAARGRPRRVANGGVQVERRHLRGSSSRRPPPSSSRRRRRQGRLIFLRPERACHPKRTVHAVPPTGARGRLLGWRRGSSTPLGLADVIRVRRRRADAVPRATPPSSAAGKRTPTRPPAAAREILEPTMGGGAGAEGTRAPTGRSTSGAAAATPSLPPPRPGAAAGAAEAIEWRGQRVDRREGVYCAWSSASFSSSNSLGSRCGEDVELPLSACWQCDEPSCRERSRARFRRTSAATSAGDGPLCAPGGGCRGRMVKSYTDKKAHTQMPTPVALRARRSKAKVEADNKRRADKITPSPLTPEEREALDALARAGRRRAAPPGVPHRRPRPRRKAAAAPRLRRRRPSSEEGRARPARWRGGICGHGSCARGGREGGATRGACKRRDRRRRGARDGSREASAGGEAVEEN